MIDPRVVLVDDAAGADVEVSHLRIAHLTLGQADGELGRVDRRVRAGREEPIPVGLSRARDRVVGGRLAAAEAVEDDEGDRTSFRAEGGGHRSPEQVDRGPWERARKLSFYLCPHLSSRGTAIHVIRREPLVPLRPARLFGGDADLADPAAPAVARPGRGQPRGDAPHQFRERASARSARNEGVRGRTLAEGRAHSAVATREPRRRARASRRASRRRLLHDREPQQHGGQGAGADRVQGHLPARRWLPGLEGRRTAHREVTVPTITMYTTAVCPYCIQAERYLKAKGVAGHRLRARRSRSHASAGDDAADRPAHRPADLHRCISRRRLRGPGRARPRGSPRAAPCRPPRLGPAGAAQAASRR